MTPPPLDPSPPPSFHDPAHARTHAAVLLLCPRFITKYVFFLSSYFSFHIPLIPSSPSLSPTLLLLHLLPLFHLLPLLSLLLFLLSLFPCLPSSSFLPLFPLLFFLLPSPLSPILPPPSLPPPSPNPILQGRRHSTYLSQSLESRGREGERRRRRRNGRSARASRYLFKEQYFLSFFLSFEPLPLISYLFPLSATSCCGPLGGVGLRLRCSRLVK